REEDGRAWKCTMCYDRLKDDMSPACAKACPTDSIQFGDLDQLREAAAIRLQTLHERGDPEAYLYGVDEAAQPGTGVRHASGLLAGGGSEQVGSGHRAGGEGAVPFDVWSRPPSSDGGAGEDPTYYDRPLLKEPVWKWYVPAYFFTGGAAGAAALLGGLAQLRD